MKLTDIHNHQTEIRDDLHLRVLLEDALNIDGYGAFILHTVVGEPELWLQISNNIVYRHYFLTSAGSHPGWQPESNNRPEHANLPETIVFLQVGASMADKSEMPKETTVSQSKAIAAAREFLVDQKLPQSFRWFEL